MEVCFCGRGSGAQPQPALRLLGQRLRVALAEGLAGDHALEDLFGALGRQARARVRRVGRGRVGDAGQHHALHGVQGGNLLAEVPLRGRGDALVAAAKVDGVDVEGEDLLLGAEPLQREGAEDLGKLPLQLLLLGEVEVLEDLLGDGAAALGQGLRLDVVEQRPADGDGVDARVRPEALVLHGDDRIHVEVGQVLEGDAQRIVAMSSTHIAMLDAIGETAREVLPSNYTYEFGGISREESKTTNNATLIFLLCMVLVYLILCALYESVFIPFAVLLSVPCGLMGSFLFAWLFGLENNIYMQTGLIMIIGLLAKTAILLTEYAGKRRSEGMTLAQAAYSAAKVRLRPILMTVLSMVFGLVPLMMAHGVGANGSRSLATGVIGGMIVGTLALLFLVPSLFIVFQYIQERVKHN